MSCDEWVATMRGFEQEALDVMRGVTRKPLRLPHAASDQLAAREEPHTWVGEKVAARQSKR